MRVTTALPALLLLSAALASPAVAAPSIRELSIVIDGGQVLASFRLDEGFSPAVVERIESGLPTGFVYELRLARDRKRWWDDGMDTARLEVVAMYNAVTHEYLVNTKLEGKLLDSRTLRDAGDLERAMTRFTSLPVFALTPVRGRERYLVRARVELGTGHLLGFIPVLRTTEWSDSNKVRVTVP